MKIQFICLPLMFLMASCGADGSQSGRTSSRNPSRSGTEAFCKVSISKYDAPAVIAKKAYRMQSECKLNTEEALIRKMSKL